MRSHVTSNELPLGSIYQGKFGVFFFSFFWLFHVFSSFIFKVMMSNLDPAAAVLIRKR